MNKMVSYKTIVLILNVFFIHNVSGLNLFMNLIDSIYNTIYSAPNEGQIKDTLFIDKEYDFVVVGAGTGGSVVANRLTEIPEWKVLLLEAGDDEPFYTEVPLTALTNSATDLNWGYRTDRVEGACQLYDNQSCVWPRGKVLGGTSVLNLMVYTRGVRKDYDDWAAMGNTGWSYDEILPYFKKSEDINVDELKSSQYHGVGGYQTVGESPYTSPFYTHFKTAATEMGYDFLDANGERTIGFTRVQATIRKGKRCSASKAFLESIRFRPNLHVSKMSRVTKILIDPATKKAVGVEFIKNNIKRVVKARKEVILSAGTIGSAHLLLLSGVGTRKNLEDFNIPVIKESPVGYNLQDHVTFFGVLFLLNQTASETFRSAVLSPKAIWDYTFLNSGPLTVPGGAEGIAFMKSKYSTVPGDAPDIELVMGVSGLNQGLGVIVSAFSGLPVARYNQMMDGIIGEPSMSITPILLSPKSRGRISLKSSNPFHWPSLQPNYFQDESDIQVLREAAKKTVEISKTSGFQKLGARLHDRKYPGCEQYDFGTDEHWECAIRQTTMTLSHLSGTAKMGPSSDPTAVVDPRLKVIGISGLRVIDASIMPVIPRGHTNAVVLMIAEKATDMIKEDWARQDISGVFNNIIVQK